MIPNAKPAPWYRTRLTILLTIARGGFPDVVLAKASKGSINEGCNPLRFVLDCSHGQAKEICRNPGKNRRYVIGSAGFAKISAVEGIHLTDPMKERAAVKRAKRLTAEEYRRTIIASHRKG